MQYVGRHNIQHYDLFQVGIEHNATKHEDMQQNKLKIQQQRE
jgi:hypothetical protein